MMLTGITKAEWKKAEQYFKKNPHRVKMRGMKGEKTPDMNTHSFVKIKGEVFAIANRRFSGEEKYGLLGQGSYGKVKVIQSKAGENFAIKVEGSNKKIEASSERKLMEIMGLLKSQAVRLFKDEGRESKNHLDVPTESKLYSVMRLIPGQSLHKTLYVPLPENPAYSNLRDLSVDQRYKIAYQCCQAIQNLHDQGYTHGDIKPDNFMCKEDGDTILIEAVDFGMAEKVGADNISPTKNVGTLLYLAPEIIPEMDANLNIYDRKAEDIDWRINDRPQSFPADTYSVGTLCDIDLNLPPEADELIIGMTMVNPADRITLTEAMRILEELCPSLKNSNSEEIKDRDSDLNDNKGSPPKQSKLIKEYNKIAEQLISVELSYKNNRQSGLNKLENEKGFNSESFDDFILKDKSQSKEAKAAQSKILGTASPKLKKSLLDYKKYIKQFDRVKDDAVQSVLEPSVKTFLEYNKEFKKIAIFAKKHGPHSVKTREKLDELLIKIDSFVGNKPIGSSMIAKKNAKGRDDLKIRKPKQGLVSKIAKNINLRVFKHKQDLKNNSKDEVKNSDKPKNDQSKKLR